jgi:2-alkyl-3-oxoalkanoate reductase
LFALVTGPGGFLGQYIAEQLVARGDRVRGFSRGNYPQLDELGIETVTGDLRDAVAVANACHDVDVVFHCAGVAGIWGSWEHFHGINTLGTHNIVAACREHEVSRLVYTSSPSVTFDGTDQQGIDESIPYPTRWLCHYPHTKALGEQHVLENDSETLRTCALRPHLIWGPRDQHLIPRLIDRARSGKLRRIGDGTNLVDMVYVENAATAHLQAADALEAGSPVCGRAYFISQGEPVNCWDWINEILALSGIEPVEKSISLKAAWCIGAAMEVAYHILGKQSEPRMTRFLAAQLATSHHFDISRAREDFGYAPTISTAEGMRRLAKSLK